MVKIENVIARMAEYPPNSAKNVVPWVGEAGAAALHAGYRLGTEAYRQGAQAQLLACIADLRTWAEAYRAATTGGEAADVLTAFADDWQRELHETARP